MPHIAIKREFGGSGPGTSRGLRDELRHEPDPRAAAEITSRYQPGVMRKP